jgi:glycosyltransferase involved in cell wall biosynthesis
MCSEASFLSSGFAVYAKELLSRLHATDKYEIAEFASYGTVNDPRDTTIKWKYYPNAVGTNDPRYPEYNSRADNQFGRWRFEKVLLDFRPDVVIDVRDYWMSAYQALSPLRKYFHWILMPTVDSEPQQEPWLDTYLSADAIFTYSDWGANVLKKQTSDKVNYIDTAAPGVDLNIFKPQTKEYQKNLKQDLGLPQDSIIIGSVMRNQKRKLIPDLCLEIF